MEAEFGRFFLADYHCGNQQWPSAAEHAKQQWRQQQQQQSLQPAPLESQLLGALEELPGGASSSVQRSLPAATSAVPLHGGMLGSSRAEHGAENGKEIDSATRLDVGTTSLKGQSIGQGASGHLLTGPDESPVKPERPEIPENIAMATVELVLADALTGPDESPVKPERLDFVPANTSPSSRGRCVSFDTDGRGPSVDKATASVSSAALTTINYEAQVPGLVTSPTTVQKHAEIDAQVQRALDLLFADERLWQLISTELSKSMRLRATLSRKQELSPGKSFRFRVQVPKPYPGVQYRKSKDLNDKYPRYAKHGSTIVGEVEADGEWVKVREMYLPMRLGPVQILELMPETRGTDADGRTGSNFSDANTPQIPYSSGRW